MSRRKSQRRASNEPEAAPSSLTRERIDPELLAAVLLRAEPSLRQATQRALGRSGWAVARRHLPCPS
ncbi:MAG: hypothetical protein IPL40_08400 [Proteobacteria bacterium]|nr:hypothetical protein [Pseudomonadota bacterium]